MPRLYNFVLQNRLWIYQNILCRHIFSFSPPPFTIVLGGYFLPQRWYCLLNWRYKAFGIALYWKCNYQTTRVVLYQTTWTLKKNHTTRRWKTWTLRISLPRTLRERSTFWVTSIEQIPSTENLLTSWLVKIIMRQCDFDQSERSKMFSVLCTRVVEPVHRSF